MSADEDTTMQLGERPGNDVTLATSRDSQLPGTSTSASTANVNAVPAAATGADIYKVFVRSKKRGRSPGKVTGKGNTIPQVPPISTQNRFGALDNDQGSSQEADQATRPVAPEKPTPMYIRNDAHIANIPVMMSNLSVVNFDIKILKRGLEAKLQLYSVDDYRKVQDAFTSLKIPYYTYQLKSERSLKVAMKGLHPNMATDDIKKELIERGYQARQVYAVKNFRGEKTGIFTIDLDPNYEANGSGSHHPIYDLKRFMHLVVSVEEPRKIKEPVRCFNCQEFGHIRSRCGLRTICATCSQSHKTEECLVDRANASLRKCNNCSGNHATSWKGCVVYKEFLEKMNPRQRREYRIARNNVAQQAVAQQVVTQQVVAPQIPSGTQNTTQRQRVSYANTINGGRAGGNNAQQSSDPIMNIILMMQTNINAMQANFNEMLKKQNTMEQSIKSLSDALNNFLKRK